MNSFKDIYFKIDINLIRQGFWESDIAIKKNLIDIELRKYIITKIQELGGYHYLNNKNLSVSDLICILASILPEGDKNTLCDFTHYILNVARSLQNWYIIWEIEDDETLIETPFVDFDERDKWSSLKTHSKTDYVKTFNFVYDIFKNEFLTKTSAKNLSLTNNKH